MERWPWTKPWGEQGSGRHRSNGPHHFSCATHDVCGGGMMHVVEEEGAAIDAPAALPSAR